MSDEFGERVTEGGGALWRRLCHHMFGAWSYAGWIGGWHERSGADGMECDGGAGRSVR